MVEYDECQLCVVMVISTKRLNATNYCY